MNYQPSPFTTAKMKVMTTHLKDTFFMSLTKIRAMSSCPVSNACQRSQSPDGSIMFKLAPRKHSASTTTGKCLFIASCKAVSPSCVLLECTISFEYHKQNGIHRRRSQKLKNRRVRISNEIRPQTTRYMHVREFEPERERTIVI